MLKKYNLYLCEKLVSFLHTSRILPGKKYFVKFDNQETLNEFYRALCDYSESKDIKEDFVYELDDRYKTYQIKIGEVKILVAKEDPGVTLDFLTKFRNSVGEGREYSDCALLLLICSKLDSIIDGSESLQREGLPFYYGSIIKDIEEKLLDETNNMTCFDKEIIRVELEARKADKYSDKTSLELYRPILEIIDTGEINKNEYKSFSMFFDSDLQNARGDDIKKRIELNRKWFKEIEEAVRSKNVEQILSSKIDNKMLTKIERLEKDVLEDDWADSFDFKHILQSNENKKLSKNLDIEDILISFIQSCTCTKDEDYYVFEHSKKGAKKQKFSILIFNDSNFDNLLLHIRLSEKLKKNGATYRHESGMKPYYETEGELLKLKFALEENEMFSRYNLCNDETNCKIEINLCVVPCKASSFKTLIPKIAYIDSKKKYILLNKVEEDIQFNIDLPIIEKLDIVEGSVYTFLSNKRLCLHFNNSIKEKEKVKFGISFNTASLHFVVEQNQEKSTKISGIKLYSEKLSGKEYVYDSQSKITFNRTEYRLDKSLKEVLDLEFQIVGTGIIHGEIDGAKVKELVVNIPETLKEKYLAILNYYKTRNTVPSLCPMNNDIAELYKDFIEEINFLTSQLPDGLPITNSNVKNIILIGTFLLAGEEDVVLSPFHPINLAHQLSVYNVRIGKDLDLEIAKKINSRQAYPYFYLSTDKLYKVIDNSETLVEWKKYILSRDNSKNGNRYYVAKLVTEKIDLFVKHFNCVFEGVQNDELKIDLFNLGDCEEVFEGIIKYYCQRFNNIELEKTAKSIVVSIYNDKIVKTFFDILANEFELKKYLGNSSKFVMNEKKVNLNELIAFIKEKLSYYVRLTSEPSYEYAHLSFYEMSSSVAAGNNKQDSVSSGIMLNGLLSGLSSKYMGDSYRTSFGSKDMSKGLVEELYKNMNALGLYSRKSDPFDKNACISTEIRGENEDVLRKIYNASYWVTFIDPKVDLNFFINTFSGEPITVIHYSDQYTTSNGYDAITVTNKTRQYIDLISNHMKLNNLTISEEEANKIINVFNAVNGNWLLKLISSDQRYEKEKISLISAVKLSIAKFHSDDIIWVPLAMEEILRVTGAVKLNSKEGLLSAKNLNAGKGAKSDDLLMVGINISNIDNIKVYLHPIEVKIGEENYICSSKEKAKQQIETTKNKILNKNLGDEADSDIVRMMRRNYLMQLVLISAQKLKLYNVYQNQDWDKILEGPIREKLLNEKYEISNEIDEKIGFGSILQFANVDDEISYLQCQEDGCTLIQSTIKYALQLLTKEIDDIREENDFNKMIPLGEMVKDCAKVENNRLKVNAEIEVEEDYNNIEIMTPEVIGTKVEETFSKTGISISFGTKANGDALLWCPNDTNLIMHTNTGIIGTMGTGKTQFTKSLITQLYRNSSNNVEGKKIGILIFDYKGDYNQQKIDFINATDAKVYSLYHLPYNPLSIIQGSSFKPMLPLHIANSFKETLSKAYGLGIKQETLLRDVIMGAYEDKGIDKGNRETWSREAPTFHDVYNRYMARDDIKEDSLYAAMKALEEFEIFEKDVSKTVSLYELIDGVTVIDLSGYDSQIQNLVVAITLDLFYMQMQANGHSLIRDNYRQLSKMILVDEADNFLSQDFTSIKKIMKEGREFGVGTILSTQLLSHFSNDSGDFANYIFTWVVHNVADLSSKDVKKIFNTQTKADEDRIYRDIKNLQKHHSIVKFTSASKAEYIEDLPFYKLNQ